jgi:hypothetical protein
MEWVLEQSLKKMRIKRGFLRVVAEATDFVNIAKGSNMSSG